MATTYAYGGEFSSDEEVDRVEPEVPLKPTNQLIEETIESIKALQPEQDITIPDHVLAALLDHFKTQRGPIVDSTRKLYKKIIFRLIRGEQQPSNGDTHNIVVNNNNTDNNNIVTDIISKKQQLVEAHSSDDDEPMPPVSSQSSVERNLIKAAARVKLAEQTEPMEVDNETPGGPIRSTKQVDISSSESETSESGNEDSDVLDLTPVKPTTQIKSSTPLATLSAKRSIIREKESTPGAKAKPYTRSQRVAATRTVPGGSKAKKGEPDVAASVASLNISPKSSKSKRISTFITSAIVMVVLALLLYYFRSHISRMSTDKLGIKF